MSTITINKLIKQGEELKLSLIPIPNPTFNTHTWQSNENRSTYNEWSILVTRFLEKIILEIFAIKNGLVN